MAAEKVLKKLNEHLDCSICLDTYTNPKLLQCFHVYCQQCLVPLVRDQEGQPHVTCPTCRQVTLIPDRGVAGLQSAFHINRMLEIKNACQESDTPEEGATGDTTSIKYCIEHEEEYKLYCQTCGELICWKCPLKKRGKHHDHDYEELKVALDEYKEEITASLEPMEKQVAAIQKALAQLDISSGEISDQRAITEDSIHGSFRQLHEVLNVRETELISQLDRMTQEKLKCLAAQRDQIETTLARLNSCLHFMRESLKTSSEEDMLMMKANTVSQVKELTAPFQPDTLEPNAKADIIFSASADATAVCWYYGCLLLANIADPSQCYTTYDVEAKTVVMHAVNCEGRPCEEPIRSLKCEVVSEITGAKTSCRVERRGQSQYEISYQPTIKGRHQLHIRVEGRHIKGSPFSLAVRSVVQKLGNPMRTIRLGGTWKPLGVAVNQRGEVVVTEQSGSVSVFGPGGEKLRTFGQSQLKVPLGVTVDGKRNILVADCGNNRIQMFTVTGRFLTHQGREQTPYDIAFSASNDKIYVVQHNCVLILNTDFTFSSTFGKKGSGNGHFLRPNGIACDSTGKVYVADSGNHRIQVFTAEGKLLRMFGKRGEGRGELDRPVGIAVDTSGMVYVSEANNHRVSVFTSEGQFVTSFGETLQEPQYLAVDDCGVVYVCDSTGSVVMF